MASWALVTTVKAPKDEVLAFVAHHLSLGASHLYIYFDDPADPAVAAVAGHPRITAIRCTDWYWIWRGGRYSRVPPRQVVNARDAARRCKADWLGHIDVDEFLFAPRPVSDILADVPAKVPTVLMEPFEALHEPGLPDDIFTARHFRGVLDGPHESLRPAVFGAWAPALHRGSLGHAAGKSFCRPRHPTVKINLHWPKVGKAHLVSRFHLELRMLHFHAQNLQTWREALPYRFSSSGAYCRDLTLQSHLSGVTDEVIDDFYAATMTVTSEKVALLRQHDRLVTVDLGLRAKVAALAAGSYG